MQALQSVNKRMKNIQYCPLKFFQCSQHRQILFLNFLVFPLFCPPPVGKMWSLDFFFILPNPPSPTMTLGSTKLLTEMSNRDLPGGKGQPPSVSWLSRKCGSLDVPQPYVSSRTVTGRVLPLPLCKIPIHMGLIIIKLRRNPQFSFFTLLG
jgi:hypothetical protein